MTIYAIVKTGAKQYKVSPGQIIEVEYLPAEEGTTLELDHVLLVAKDSEVVVGTPTVVGARVLATPLGRKRSKKLVVFKFKSKVRYRRKTGHRQGYTRLEIKEIVLPAKVAGPASNEETTQQPNAPGTV